MRYASMQNWEIRSGKWGSYYCVIVLFNLLIAVSTAQYLDCMKDQSLFQSAATLTSFYCLIINLTVRSSAKCTTADVL